MLINQTGLQAMDQGEPTAINRRHLLTLGMAALVPSFAVAQAQDGDINRWVRGDAITTKPLVVHIGPINGHTLIFGTSSAGRSMYGR